MAGKDIIQKRMALQAVESATDAAFKLQETIAEVQVVLAKARDALAVLESTVHHALVDAHPPVCPKCHGPMTARRNRESGGWFWGCVAYPKCKGSRDPMKWQEEALAKLREATGYEPRQLSIIPKDDG